MRSEQDLLIRTSSYPILASQTGLDAPRLARILEGAEKLEGSPEYFGPVDLVGRDWVRLGLWSREPTFGALISHNVVAIQAMVTTFLYLRPKAGPYIDRLDVFSVMFHEKSESDLDNLFWEADDQYGLHMSGLFNMLVGDRYEYHSEDDRNSGIPISSVLWNEQDPDITFPVLTRRQLDNKPWSSIPEDDRRKIESGLLSFSTKCDYQTPGGLSLRGITWWNNNIDLHFNEDLEQFTPFSDQVELLFTSAVGHVLDTLLTVGGAETFFREKALL